MVSIQERLSSMDDALPPAKFATKIIGSLPISYCPTTSALSAMAKRMKAPLEPDEVIEAVLEEFHHRKFQDKAAETALAAVGKGRRGKFRTNQNASSSSSSKDKSNVECWKCGKMGHFKSECRSRKKPQGGPGQHIGVYPTLRRAWHRASNSV